MSPDTLTRVFFLMGTLLEITLVGPDRTKLDSLAQTLHQDARQVVEAVYPLYDRDLPGTLRVNGLVDTFLLKSLDIRKRTGGMVDPFYKTPSCDLHHPRPGLWVFLERCVWDPSAFLKGYVVDRIFSRLPREVSAAYVSFGGSSIRVRGCWKVEVKGPDPLIGVVGGKPDPNLPRKFALENQSLGVSASWKRGDEQAHLYAGGRVLRGTVTVTVVDTGAEQADVEATRWAIRLLKEQAHFPEHEDLEGEKQEGDLHPLPQTPAFLKRDAEEHGPGAVPEELGCTHEGEDREKETP